MIDHAMLDDIMGELEDEDDTQTGKRGLSLVHGPADPDGSNADDVHPSPAKGGDKLAELVASLNPEEKAKLRALLDADDEAAPKEA